MLTCFVPNWSEPDLHLNLIIKGFLKAEQTEFFHFVRQEKNSNRCCAMVLVYGTCELFTNENYLLLLSRVVSSSLMFVEAQIYETKHPIISGKIIFNKKEKVKSWITKTIFKEIFTFYNHVLPEILISVSDACFNSCIDLVFVKKDNRNTATLLI